MRELITILVIVIPIYGMSKSGPSAMRLRKNSMILSLICVIFKIALVIQKLRIAIQCETLKNVQFCPMSRKVIFLTTDIHRVFRGLKVEPKTEIG